ncbi:ChrR family anti-sigma-E factor [Shimia sp. SDUM112013]|uniref:ChrR family anti-sigma-E factor n=1 Tax=Shimia sp. SDUM112013 TaxID=3136160 RepID=UPI0032EB12CD
MRTISHHIPEPILAAYVSGNLPEPFALVVAAHISLCEDCRAAAHAHEQMGGLVLEGTDSVAVSSDLKAALFAQLDDMPLEAPPSPARAIGPYPAPVAEYFTGKEPRWKSLGRGVKQSILMNNGTGSVRLLYIPPSMAMPDHSHGGLELTLVLQGSFSDSQGFYARGDVEVADSDVTHTPIAGPEAPCICLAATDASLRFNALVPRLLQPLFKI